MRNVRILAALGSARCSGGGERRCVIHLDAHERLRLPRQFAIGEGSRRPGEPRLRHGAAAGTSAPGPATSISATTSDVDYEVDLYTGFSGGDEDGLGWDVGLVYYAYPDESDFNYPEIYGSLSYGWFKGKLWYSNDFGGDSIAARRRRSTSRGERATFPLPAEFLDHCARRLQLRRLLGRRDRRLGLHRLFGRRRLHGQPFQPGAEVRRHDADDGDFGARTTTSSTTKAA